MAGHPPAPCGWPIAATGAAPPRTRSRRSSPRSRAGLRRPRVRRPPRRPTASRSSTTTRRSSGSRAPRARRRADGRGASRTSGSRRSPRCSRRSGGGRSSTSSSRTTRARPPSRCSRPGEGPGWHGPSCRRSTAAPRTGRPSCPRVAALAQRRGPRPGTVADAVALGCRGVAVEWRAIDPGSVAAGARRRARGSVVDRPPPSDLRPAGALGVVAVCVEAAPRRIARPGRDGRLSVPGGRHRPGPGRHARDGRARSLVDRLLQRPAGRLRHRFGVPPSTALPDPHRAPART